MTATGDILMSPDSVAAAAASSSVETAGRTCRVEQVTCCVCGSDEAEPVAAGFDFEYQTTTDDFSMVRCRNCGLWYLNPRPTPAELPTIYPPQYYAYNYDRALHPLAHKAKSWLDERKIRGWLKHLRTNAPRFLDVGCGDGRYLAALHRRGVPKHLLHGVELSADVVKSLDDRGYCAHHGRIEEIEGLPERHFDLVVMLQVLEHVANPAETVAVLASLLSDDGVLVLETPNVDSLDRRLFPARYWGGYHFPRHWNLFTEATLRRLLRDKGLEPVSVKYLPAPSFWIYSLHHVVKYALKMPRLAKWLDPFRNLPLLALVTPFDILRARAGGRTSNMQMIARRTK